ncbi:HAMP domain-containing protein [Heliobacillus mobilis]|uniref:HAMP domain-containing protein n=1 Tax=Heliobacterium mobile TaxID=28064 RepID=A0A6I3SP83_HELMO|nr:methyl-accepting chemotaxis protein [Heliobacterium mobile]MTV50526.1 HAMP domain-containing protein [Heliobacterium mobile]
MRKIKHKIMAAIMVTTFLLTLFIGGSSVWNAYQKSQEDLMNQKKQLFIQYDNLIKNQVDQAYGLFVYAYNKQISGELSEVQAKKLAYDTIKSLRYGEKKDGYFWIDALDYTLIAHPMLTKQEGSNRKDSKDPKGVFVIQEVIKAAQGKNNGFSEYLWEKPEDVGTGKLTPKRAYSKLFTEWGWVISTGNYVDDIDLIVDQAKQESWDATKRQITVLMFFSCISLLISGAVGLFLSRKITDSLSIMMESIERDDLGKITIRKANVQSQDEIGDLAAAVNDMTGQVHYFVQQVIDSSAQITGNVKEVNLSCEQLNRSSFTTSTITQQINAAMEESAAATQEINSTIEEIYDRTQKMNQRASHGVEITQHIEQRAAILKDEAHASNEQAKEVFFNIKSQLTSAMKESQQVEKINDLANTILRITEQTNLLALNAAIEAARAGEVGQGFAVVAGEIRKLAEESAKTVTNIQQIVNVALSSVTNLAETSGKAIEFMDHEIISSYGKLLTIGDQYDADAKHLEAFMQEFQSTCEQITQTMTHITRAMNQITVSTGESADGISQVATQTSDILNNVNTIRKMSNDTITYLDSLNDLVTGFKF